MAGSGAIRWRKVDAERLAKDVKNFNAKLSRILAKDPASAAYLPERKSVQAIKAGELGRKDINLAMRGMERFSRKGAEAAVRSATGLQITKWQKKEIQIKVNIINARRRRESAVIQAHPLGGIPDPTALKALAPKPFKPDEIQPGKEWAMYVASVDKQAKEAYATDAQKDYKNKYLKAIKEYLGAAGQPLYDFISKLTPAQVSHGIYEDPMLSIKFVSDPLAVELINETAMEKWEEFLPVEFALYGNLKQQE